MCVARKNIMVNDASSAKLHEAESIADVSQESSPRSVGGTSGSISDDHMCLKSDYLRPCRVKLLCSYGGKICPRPLDYQLRYVGGDRKIMSVSRNISYLELMAKLTKLAGKSNIVIKYQLPHEDLDALVSVLSDEDVQNMLEEHEKAESRNSLCRLRLFLFKNKRQEDVKEHYNGSKLSEQQFADNMYSGAVNSKKHQAPVTHQFPDYPFGLENASDSAFKYSKPFNQGVQRVESPVTKLSSFMAPPSPIPVSVYTPAKKAAAQFYKPPVERVQCFNGQATPQESSFLGASPRSPKTTIPVSDLLQSSDLNLYGLTCSDVSSPFSQMDLREHRYACTRPLVGIDAGSLSRKHLMDLDSEASFRINHGCDAQLLAPDAFGASLPSDFIHQKHYLGLHQEKNQHSDVLQRGNMFRERNDVIYDKPLQENDKVDFLMQNEELTPGMISNHSHQMYISEGSLGLLCRPMESGDLASSLFQHRGQRQHLHSNLPYNKTCLRNYHQQPQIQHNESMSRVCSDGNKEIRPASLHMPSKQITLPTGTFGEVLSPRQVCYPQYYFQQILPEATCNGKLSRTSCLSKDQAVAYEHSDHHGPCSPSRLQASSPTKFRDHYLHAADRLTVHDDPFIDTRARMQKNTVKKPYAEQFQKHNFQYPDGNNINGKFCDSFRCNSDIVLRQCKDLEGIMETKRHGSTTRLEAGL